MANWAAAYIRVDGKVQGVGFRSFAEEYARRLGLAGYARNLPDGRVEIEVEGEKDQIDAFLQRVRQGPPRSNVTAVDVTWNATSSGAVGFSIRL
jgi:acylphosphatase